MRILEGDLAKDERGVEPTVMKILVGIILVSIGLGIGFTMYQRFGGQAQNVLNYDIHLDSDSASVPRGDSATIEVEVSTPIGYDKQVLLTADGYPKQDISISFSPETGDPTFYSEMSISVNNDAAIENYPITIRAKEVDGEGEEPERFDLTITE